MGFSNTTSSCNHNIFQSRSQSFQPKKNSTYSITVPIITNMADATTEPKVAPAETEKPLQVEAKDEAPKETPPTLTEQASSAASAAATTATTAASNVADNVFSMFGGGAKKEKVEDEDRGENSGSAKAQKAPLLRRTQRRKPQNPKMSTSNLSFVSPRKSTSRPTRSRPSRCAPSSSSLSVSLMSGRSAELVMLDC